MCRRTDDSHAQSRGSDHSAAVEGSQKLTHESLRRKKRSMSFDKITRGGKGEADEITGQAKIFEAPVSTAAFDGSAPLKSAEVCRSGAPTNNLKQGTEEAPAGEHSRKVSSGGLSKHGADGFMELNVKSRNGYGSDKSMSGDMPMDTNIIGSKVQISEAISAPDSVPLSGIPNATSKHQAGSESGAYRSNASEDPYVGFSSSAREGVKVQAVHVLDKPFVRDSVMYENVAGHNAPHSKAISSSGRTLDHGGACAFPALLQTGISDPRNSNAGENAKDGTFSYSQDVKFQDVNSMRKSFSNFPVDATVGRPHAENSKSSTMTHSQDNSVKLNAASKVDFVRDPTASRNADSKSTDGGSNGHLTDSVKYKKEAGLDDSVASDIPVDTKVINLKAHHSKVLTPSPSVVQNNLDHRVPALSKDRISKSCEFRRSTSSSVRVDHSPSSSDDEVDKNSEAAISAAALKKALREAQAWISIAKESNGVKGFMNHGVKKNFRQVKEGKEAINLKLQEKPKFFELGQTRIENDSRTSAARKDYVAPWGTSSEVKGVSTLSVEEVNSKETEFCALERLHLREDAVIQSSSRKAMESASTLQRAAPSSGISEEKLTVYSSKPEEVDHSQKDARVLGVDVDSGLARLVEEAKCSEVLNAEKRETEVSPTDDHEALFNKYDEENTVTKISNTEESQEPVNKSDQGFMMRSFHDDLGPSNVGDTVNMFEVKEDLISETAHMAVRTNKPDGEIKAESEGIHPPCSDNSKEVLASISLEEETAEESSELDRHDQVSDSEDTDWQDYASAEENLFSTDTDDEVSDKDLNLPAQKQLDDVEDNIPMENMVEATTISEEVSAPCFNNLNEEQIAEETEAEPLQNKVTHETEATSDEKTVPVSDYSNEDPVVEETDVIGDVPVVNTVAPKAELSYEDGTAPCFDSTNEEPRAEETGGIENMAEQNTVTPEENIIDEDDMVPCFDSSNENMMVEEIIADTSEACGASLPNHEDEKAVDDLTEQNTVIPEANIMSKDDMDPCFDNSGEILMVEEIVAETAVISGVHLPSHEHEKGAAESAGSCIPEHTSLDKEELVSVAREEAQPAFIASDASSQSEASVIEIRKTDDVLEDFVADTIKESKLKPSSCEHEKQEEDVATFSDLEPRTQAQEELHNVATVESEFIEQDFETENVKGSENELINIDAPRQEDANKLESNLLHPDHINHELEAGSGFCEPLSDLSQNEETGDFELHSENLTQSMERHERKKWEIPREAFELPELKSGISEVHDTMEQDSCQLKSGISEVHDTMEQDTCQVRRQTDKHERKKWEIPKETFAIPVLGDEVVEEIEENEQDQERVTQSAEKPERKKWKIQKEVFAVPILFAEAVQETSEQEGFVIKTASEEELRMRDDQSNNLMFSKESVQHGQVQKEFSADEEQAVPDEGAFPGIRDDNSQDHKANEWMPEITMHDEKEREKQLNETADQQETKVEEGKPFGKGESKKGLEDINVKDEIKRTLGMLWNKIYKSKQEDLESVKLEAKEEDTLNDEKGRGVEKDLNLMGPVELVESPRQQDDVGAVKFSDQSSGNEENGKETSCSKQFDVNGSKTFDHGEFDSTTEVTEEVHKCSSSVSDSFKLQEDDSRSCTEETCKQDFNANDAESHSEEILSSLGSEDSTEMEQIPGHGADKSLKEGSPEKNILPSDVNECSQIDSEMVSGLDPLLPDESFVADAEDTEKMKSVFQENRPKEDKVLKTTSTNEACHGIDDEEESLLDDDISDKSCAKSEQQDTSSTKQDSKSVSDSEVAEDASSPEYELEEKKEIEPDIVEQATASSWNWVFGEVLSDTNNKQNEKPDVHLSHKEKAKIKETADGICSSTVTGKAKINEDKPSRMDARTPEVIQKEVSPDQEVLNNMMRAKERERIVVERTIREVRERAFAEARERAAIERANAEAKQKATADDQELSKKKSSEVKLAAEKNSLEDKRKAELERAAVERATAEARQRAMEKAMSRKEQVSQPQGSSSRATNVSNLGSSSKDGLDDDKPSESALRFKARNERHQRIAERAAIALAEKNMRDLTVQREQAERNRLSEVLDADVKRWASGKTSNLRALLSTLQYILGPDSGWQPIHLTEIVTADAVKKAYRKATLFVHPDKLQQRGATIKQKYICEKVFDLLKEARNRFDRDER
uniref:J domain-containing protein n=1 Tax=Kalanchoe fedtschenkoi TaxID=63787 RepID=A0A7N0VCD6_KALFE